MAVRWVRKKLIQIFLWLFIFLPIKPFHSERPYVAVLLPLTKGDLAFSHPEPGIFHGLSCKEDHINTTLADTDITRWLNPAVMIVSVIDICILAIILVMMVYILVIATFWSCNFLVHWTISGGYIQRDNNVKTQRSIIQVLIMDCQHTHLITVHSDSAGRMLYRAVRERSGKLEHQQRQQVLICGTRIIRHNQSLLEQGIHHLSTLFFLSLLGKGGGRTRLDQKPTLPELLALKVVKRIGIEWKMVGTFLLDDNEGTIIPAIAEETRGNVESSNREILRRWIQGKGISDRTWRGLLGVLEKSDCKTLADDLTLELEKPDLKKPKLSPLPDHPTIDHFRHHLEIMYCRPTDSVPTWPPLLHEKFINLAIIRREKVKSKEQRRFMIASFHGDVDTIEATKHSTTLEELLDMPTGKKLECILIEGAPGVGKSTFSWEICKRWAERTLFQQFLLVMLLRLRDESVQGAKTIEDLILCLTMAKCGEEISQYLEDNHGKDTLIILEGLDELPKHLISCTQSSIFTDLLGGKLLPDAVILVTSRPSVTPQLWKNWDKRISKHIEILGFNDQNISNYVASILDPDEIPAFDDYMCTVPTIRQIMYIPLQCGIVIELYKMCEDAENPLPLNRTELYTALVNTILTRYLVKHPKYKDDKITVEKFTDLPEDVYPVFKELTKIAYNGVKEHKLIFKCDEPIEHLGFMHVVTEDSRLSHKVNYIHNFLHLSIQEHLGAIYLSLTDTNTQEQLLESIQTEEHAHLKNMAMFWAAITKYKDMNWELVKQAIQFDCKVNYDELTPSTYVLQLIYETENVSLIEGHLRYSCELSNCSPLLDFTTVGYCIANSSYKWRLELGSNKEYIQSLSGIDLLLHALHDHSYTIDRILFWYEETEFAQKLLTGLSPHTISHLEFLVLESKTRQPLPQCLPQLIPQMNRLQILTLYRANADTLAKTLTTLAEAPISTLEELFLMDTPFTLSLMRNLLSVLFEHRESVTTLELKSCGINDEQACLLATTVMSRSLPKLARVYLFENIIGKKGREALDTCKNLIRL